MAIATAKLDDLLEAMETLSSDFESYLSKETGKVIAIGDDYWAYARGEYDDDEHPDWVLEIIGQARDILARPEHYLRLPSSWDIHEYEIMERFCTTREDSEKRDQLLRAIRGKGAFRRFKGRADQLGVLDDWYDFKITALTEKALAWCKENDVAIVQSDAQPGV